LTLVSNVNLFQIYIKGRSEKAKHIFTEKSEIPIGDEAEASSGFVAADSSKQGFSFKIKYIRNFNI
jgi:hypothetical protein